MSVGRPLVGSDPSPSSCHRHTVTLSTAVPSTTLITSSALDLETGGSLWEGSVCLAKYLIDFKERFEDKVILELGAGCGLAGITAAILGAKLVILTDLPQQIPHLEAMVELNRHLFVGEVVCIPFSFGQSILDLINNLTSSPTSSSPLIQNLLSASPHLPINYLIGADIAYDVSLLTPLSYSIHSISDSCHCTSYLVETVRWKDIYRWFLESMTTTIATPIDEESSETNNPPPPSPPFSLLDTILLFHQGRDSGYQFGSLRTKTNKRDEGEGEGEEVDLLSSFSRADVVLHVFGSLSA